jgi:hypothetical protein
MHVDKLVEWLNSKGYMPVYLPRAGAVPPDMYVHTDTHLVRMGGLRNYLPQDVHLPKNVKNRLPDIQFHSTSKKSIRGAATFLQNVLRVLGILNAPSLKLSFAGNGDVVFRLVDVTYDEIEPAAVAKVISHLVTDTIPEQYVKGNKMHIAYNYAYAARLEMRRADGSKFSGALTNAQIQNLFKLGAAAKAEFEGGDALTFSAGDAAPIAFAYKAGGVRYENGIYKFFPSDNSVQGFAARGGGTDELYLPARGVVLNVEKQLI